MKKKSIKIKKSPFFYNINSNIAKKKNTIKKKMNNIFFYYRNNKILAKKILKNIKKNNIENKIYFNKKTNKISLPLLDKVCVTICQAGYSHYKNYSVYHLHIKNSNKNIKCSMLPESNKEYVAYIYLKQIIIAYRGTQINSKDIYADLNIVIGNQVNIRRFNNAYIFYQLIRKNYPQKKIILTGHSLGGALALHIHNITNCDTIIFNPAIGLDSKYNNYLENIQSQKHQNLTTHKIKGDIVSMFSGGYGKVYEYILPIKLKNIWPNHLKNIHLPNINKDTHNLQKFNPFPLKKKYGSLKLKSGQKLKTIKNKRGGEILLKKIGNLQNKSLSKASNLNTKELFDKDSQLKNTVLSKEVNLNTNNFFEKARNLKNTALSKASNLNTEKILSNANKIKLQKIREFKPFNSELMNIISTLFSKILAKTKELILENSKNPSDLFFNFDVSKNKKRLIFAAYLLGKSYKFNNKEPDIVPLLGKDFNKLYKYNKAIKFSEVADKIYLSEKKFKDFASTKNYKIEVYQGKQKTIFVDNKIELVPKYAIFLDHGTNSIVLAIKGTSTLIDAVIDGLATIDSHKLEEQEYFIHSGFLSAGKEIIEQTKSKLVNLIKNNKEYNLVVTGHSLGGGVSTVVGVLLYDKIAKDTNLSVDVFGYASGSTFCAQPNDKPLEKYLIKYPNLQINTFVYKEDVIPRLSLYDGFILLAICTAICKLIFLEQTVNIYPDFTLDRQIVRGMYKELNIDKLQFASKITKKVIENGVKLKEGVSNFSKKINNKLKGGGNETNTQAILVKIQEIVQISIPFFEAQFKANANYYTTKTTHPGDMYLLHDNEPIQNIDPIKLSFLNFQLSSIKHHAMKKYMTSIAKFLNNEDNTNRSILSNNENIFDKNKNKPKKTQSFGNPFSKKCNIEENVKILFDIKKPDDNLFTRICHHEGIVDPEQDPEFKNNVGVIQNGKNKNMSPVCVVTPNNNNQLECKPIINNSLRNLRYKEEEALTILDTKQQGNTVSEMVNEMFKIPGNIIKGVIGCDN